MKGRGKGALTIVGTVMGAGFISGRELIVFFGGFYPTLLLVGTLEFFVFFRLFFYLGARYGGFSGVLQKLFGPFSLFVKATILFGGFITSAGMLSALNALFPQGRYVPSLALLLAACLIGEKGVKGLGTVNAFVTPAVLIGVVILAAKGKTFSPPEDLGREILPFFSVLLYVGMNAFLSMPVLCDLGGTLKQGGGGVCGGASLIVGGAIGFILSAVCSDKCSFSETLPLFYVLKGSGTVFSLLSLGGIATTLFSSFYPVYELAGRKGGNAGKILLAITTFAVSFVGFKTIVRTTYPAFGAAGVCVFGYALVREGIGRLKRREKSATPYGTTDP